MVVSEDCSIKSPIANRFTETLRMLCPPTAIEWMPDRMSQLFREITHEWSSQPWEGKYPFESGICSNLTPIEMSMSISENQDSLLRFLTQPCDPHSSRLQNLHLGASRAIDLVKALSNETTANWFNELLSDYLGWKRSIPGGNFFIWIGCEALKSQRIILKLYVNPWFSMRYRGFPAVIRAFELCSFGSECLEIGRFFYTSDKSVPLIIGLDLDDRGLVCLKVYWASSHMTVAKSERILEEYGTSQQREVWEWIKSDLDLHLSDTRNQEIHFGVRFVPHQATPTVKVNLFCKHFFSSDSDVLDTLFEGAQKFGSDLSRVRRVLHGVCSDQPDENKVELFNFLGIGESKLDVYFRPW